MFESDQQIDLVELAKGLKNQPFSSFMSKSFLDNSLLLITCEDNMTFVFDKIVS
jgi:hypothetical protein